MFPVTGPAVHVADRAYAVPLATDPGYIEALLDVCRAERIRREARLRKKSVECATASIWRGGNQRAGAIEVVAIWSHLAAADEPGHPSVPLQIQAFQQAYEQGRAAGLEPTLRHLGNSAGALVVPEARLDLVRVGIAAYGIDPAPGIAAHAGVRLRPVMRLRAQLVNVKDIPAGAGVSYGWT
jgi:alanine racemase